MKIFFAIIASSFLVGCMSTGTIQQASQGGVVVKDSAGNFGDRGAALASEHCAKYGKVAIYVSGTGSNFARRSSYICQ